MKKLKLGLEKLNIPEKIQKTKTVVTKMTGNTNFATPLPSLASVTAAINKLESSYDAALDGGKTKKAIMRADEIALDIITIQLGAYVQDISLGDEIKILSSGFEVKNKRTFPQILEAPLNAISVGSKMEGEVNLKWKPIKNAKSYLIQSTVTPSTEASWMYFNTTTKAKISVNDLPNQTIIWFRVAAIGARGQGAYSDPFKASIL